MVVDRLLSHGAYRLPSYAAQTGRSVPAAARRPTGCASTSPGEQISPRPGRGSATLTVTPRFPSTIGRPAPTAVAGTTTGAHPGGPHHACRCSSAEARSPSLALIMPDSWAHRMGGGSARVSAAATAADTLRRSAPGRRGLAHDAVVNIRTELAPTVSVCPLVKSFVSVPTFVGKPLASVLGVAPTV